MKYQPLGNQEKCISCREKEYFALKRQMQVEYLIKLLAEKGYLPPHEAERLLAM